MSFLGKSGAKEFLLFVDNIRRGKAYPVYLYVLPCMCVELLWEMQHFINWLKLKLVGISPCGKNAFECCFFFKLICRSVNDFA